jgi:hypothetical protein
MNKEQKTSQTTEPAIAVDTVLAPVFTWEDFKKYVETYDPKKHGANDLNIVMHDMLYGIGLLMDKSKYEYHKGYKEFKQYLKDVL